MKTFDDIGRCPGCNKQMISVSGIAAKPLASLPAVTYTVCGSCGHLLRSPDKRNLEKIPEEELRQLARDIYRILMTTSMLIRKKNELKQLQYN